MEITYHKKKRKKRRPTIIEHWLLYVVVRLIIAVILIFDIKTMHKFAMFLGGGMWTYYKRGRKRALENLYAAYPDKDEAWIQATGRRSFQELVMLAIDVVFTPKLVNKNNWEQYSCYKTAERLKWMLQEHRSLLLVAAHYSNFEIMGYLLGEFGFDIYSIARPLDNPFINNYLYRIRQRRGQKIIDKKGAAEMMEQIIKQGSSLCFIADQDAGAKGVFVDFFGRKASTYKSIGLLAITQNVPIAVGISRRIDDRFYFEISVPRIIYPDEWKDKQDPLLWITQEYTSEFEKAIRKDPSQYWWLHRRWKTRPKDENRTAI